MRRSWPCRSKKLRETAHLEYWRAAAEIFNRVFNSLLLISPVPPGPIRNSVTSQGLDVALYTQLGTCLLHSSFLSGISLNSKECARNSKLLTLPTSKSSDFSASPLPRQMRERLGQKVTRMQIGSTAAPVFPVALTSRPALPAVGCSPSAVK
ncbi:hypothetical protein HJG60_008923 [Phyllostomus discolor]|uniref:Uncharacterized protein n=1 Tax=Phyllostomus discolor TaxID=89673 RepID=A0A833YWS4_9CHIR|nr:hypothetical protein HJG60_008923 [Phyllostomus discolor]